MATEGFGRGLLQYFIYYLIHLFCPRCPRKKYHYFQFAYHWGLVLFSFIYSIPSEILLQSHLQNQNLHHSTTTTISSLLLLLQMRRRRTQLHFHLDSFSFSDMSAAETHFQKYYHHHHWNLSRHHPNSSYHALSWTTITSDSGWSNNLAYFEYSWTGDRTPPYLCCNQSTCHGIP